MWFTPLFSIDIGETLGLYHVIRWIYVTYNSNVDFEVDSKIVADYFNRGGRYVTEFGLIMDSNIQFCSSYLSNSYLVY